MRILSAVFCLLLLPAPSVFAESGHMVAEKGMEAGGDDAVGTRGGDAVVRRVEYLRGALSLDQEQAKDLEEILRSLDRGSNDNVSSMGWGRGSHGKHSGGSGNRQSSIQADDRTGQIHAAVQAVLHGDQLARYESLVQEEREWWLDPQLIRMDEMLELSLDQCRRIHPVLRRSRIRVRALGENARNGDRDAMEKVREEVKETNEVMMEFLDENQQEIWREHVQEMKKQMEDTRSQRGMGHHGGGMGGGGRGGGKHFQRS